MTFPVPQNILLVYTMTGQLLNGQGPNAWQPVYWDNYNVPDLTGANSGYFGQLQNIQISAVTQVSSATNTAVVPTGPAGGDLGGNYPNPLVVGLQGNPLLPQTLTMVQDGYVMTWNGTEWLAAFALPGFTAGGDLMGSSTDQTVIGLYDNPVASTTPVASAVPVYNIGLAQYDIRQLTQDDIGVGFSITSFSGGSVVEIGATVTNPAFSASYSHIPNSAQITNTDGTDSPLVLITPFTSGTVVGAFHKTVATAVTFTLTAIYTSTKTATQAINFEARSFGGVGTAGATSVVNASGNNAVLSTGNTINSVGLHTSDVGQVYGPFSPSAQKIYLLLIGGSHTFKDANTGFSFAFNSPTAVSFTNQNSAVVSMFLYESTNTLSATFSIQVVS